MKRKCSEDSMLDKISNLPDHLIQRILCALPIGDAVQTSILSKEWRYKWTQIPYLVFQDDFLKRCSRIRTFGDDEFFEIIIDKLLLLHNAPIQKLMIDLRGPSSGYYVERWLPSMSESAMEMLVLELGWSHYNLPSCVFGFGNLIVLQLSRCLLKPPTAFRGFHRLKCLCLADVTLSEDDFETLIAKCSSLQKLSLFSFCSVNHLKIFAPNLKSFFLRGAFEDISFINTFRLTSISIHNIKQLSNDQIMIVKNSSSLINFFDGIPQVRRLVIVGNFVEHLAAHQAAASSAKPCKDLAYLRLCIDFNSSNQISVLLSLLENSPNLRQLEIHCVSEGDEGIRRESDSVKFEGLRFCCGHLRHVKINGASVVGSKLEFIKYLLSNSPLLRRMIIIKKSSLDTDELLKSVRRFRRLSKHSKLIYDNKYR